MRADTDKTFHAVAFILILLAGAYLRTHNLGRTPLTNDEGETALYARTILEEGRPSLYYRGTLMFLGRYLPLNASGDDLGVIDPNMYAVSSADSDNRGVPRLHPYGDMYLIALAYSFFGESDASARIMFALIGVVSTLLTYQLAELLYNRRTALLAFAFHSLNWVFPYFERQSRYYSLTVFGLLAVTYLFLKAFRSGSWGDYLAGSVVMAFYIYAQPAGAFSALLVLSVLWFYTHRNVCRWLFNKKLFFAAMVTFILVIPYPMFYKPWTNPAGLDLSFFSVARMSAKSVLLYAYYAIQVSLVFVLAGALLMLSKGERDDYLVLIILVVYPLASIFVTPPFAFARRNMLPLVPFLCVVCARFISEAHSFLRKRLVRWPEIKAASLSILYLSAALSLINPYIQAAPFTSLYLPFKYSDELWPMVNNIRDEAYGLGPLAAFVGEINSAPQTVNVSDQWQSGWVPGAIDFLKQKNVSDEWVFLSYMEAPFILYTDYSIQSVWPLRKEFIDSIHEKFYIILGPGAEDSCAEWRYEFVGPEKLCNPRNFDEKIKSCVKHSLESGALVYECN